MNDFNDISCQSSENLPRKQGHASVKDRENSSLFCVDACPALFCCIRSQEAPHRRQSLRQQILASPNLNFASGGKS